MQCMYPQLSGSREIDNYHMANIYMCHNINIYNRLIELILTLISTWMDYIIYYLYETAYLQH